MAKVTQNTALEEPHHIVAIGASAGGIEELNLFFDNTPMDGVCYIIIQHLSKDFKSRMAELLAHHSSLTVLEAQEGSKVRPNYVYLVPSDKFMTISGGKLKLKEKVSSGRPHLTINAFLISLAKDAGKKAIAIILSGLGSDGTLGIKAIKKAGGMVIARNPLGSEFGSMPTSAIETGLVDSVLEPEQMPTAIAQHVEKSITALTMKGEDQEVISDILKMIHMQLPLDFSEYKQSTIARRISKRIASGSFPSMEKYVNHLRTSPEEVKALAQDLLISVTAFFRDKDAYDYLETKVISELLSNLPSDGQLKIWVAGCATGEEAYSMAMLVCEQLTGPYKNITAKIFATDIDQPALQHATKGMYDIALAKNLSAERLERFFITEGSTIQIKPEIRRMVIFAQHDLTRNPPYCNLQLISCRNLLIYMTPTLQKKVFNMLHFGLRLNGYLFLGSSESPTPIMDKLEVANKKYKIYKNIQVDRHPRFESFTMPEILDARHALQVLPPILPSKPSVNNLAEAVSEELSDGLGCLTICIDQLQNVVKTYGDTGKYLIQKNFTLNLTELLPRPLAIVFNSLLLQAEKTGERASIIGLNLATEKSSDDHHVNISVSPLSYKTADGTFFMVCISDNSTSNLAIQSKVFDETFYHDQYILNLEEELRDHRGQLYAAQERLEVTNENMQSFNEELLSANEEMQSTNEEMQSINEELQTINSDYQAKNRELVELNDDLNNYFKSNITAQLFVNLNMQLVKFSPGAFMLINLRESDIGRPLSDLTTNIKIHTIIADIEEVLEKGTIIRREIQTNDDKWYQVITMPYMRELTRQQTGAIITFNDVTELKIAKIELDVKNKALERINADLDHFIHAASHDLLAPLTNIELSIAAMNRITVNDTKLLNCINIINNSITKFSALIKDIAVIAETESDIDREEVDLKKLLDDILWSLESKMNALNAKITMDLKVSRIIFSKKNLRSILYNLISNGIKFHNDQIPEVHILAKKEEGYIALSVQDNGKGIRKSDFHKIFDLYGRLNQHIEGHGIGLYLTKKIINAAGGNLIVESELGKGSKFTIYIKDQEN